MAVSSLSGDCFGRWRTLPRNDIRDCTKFEYFVHKSARGEFSEKSFHTHDTAFLKSSDEHERALEIGIEITSSLWEIGIIGFGKNQTNHEVV